MNYLPNGTVLPFGLMGVSEEAGMAGFNKTYRNSALRLGIIIKSHDVSEKTNISKLTSEYDVSVFEQQEDKGSSIVTYRNCISAEGMGSIADFFERTLRVKESTSANSKTINTSGQNGAVVLILCLDAMSEKAIIVGAVTHPDRKSTLAGHTAHLEGEFNGVNIKVEDSGAATFTFKGATDNDGKQKDASQGNTVLSVEQDGSFQINHKTITFRLDKGGVVSLKSDGDVNVDCATANVKASGDATITAAGTATVEAPTVKLGAGAAEAVIKGDTFKKMVFDVHIHPTPIGPSGPPSVPMAPASLSTKVKTE